MLEELHRKKLEFVERSENSQNGIISYICHNIRFSELLDAKRMDFYCILVQIYQYKENNLISYI